MENQSDLAKQQPETPKIRGAWDNAVSEDAVQRALLGLHWRNFQDHQAVVSARLRKLASQPITSLKVKQ